MKQENVLDISVVVPVYNEQDNVSVLIKEISVALANSPHEIIFIDDASTDGTAQVLASLKTEFPTLRAISHQKNSGQSRAIRTGIFAARSAVIATLDGDGQNDPADIPALLEHFKRQDRPINLGMVGGRRTKRKDSFMKKLGSRFGNGVRKWLLKDQADDTGCGLKVFEREAFLRLPYFDHIHRYIPSLMLREGYALEFLDVNHRERQYGTSKYTNLGRLVVSIADLWGVMWLNRRSRLPEEVKEL